MVSLNFYDQAYHNARLEICRGDLRLRGVLLQSIPEQPLLLVGGKGLAGRKDDMTAWAIKIGLSLLKDRCT